MDKKYPIVIIIAAIALIAIIGINFSNNFNKETNTTVNNTTNNNTINVTHIENNTDSNSNDNANSESSRYEEIRDPEYLGDEVVYKDTATGKYYYNGQEMNYEKLADDYNREHQVGPYAKG